MKSDGNQISFLTSVEIRANTSDGKKTPRFTMVAYNGGLMQVEGFSRPVAVDLSGLEIISQKLPIRFSHDHDKGVGQTTRIWVSDGKLLAEGFISRDTPWAKDVVNSAKSGYQWQVSIGAKVLKHRFIKKGETATVNRQVFEGEFILVEKSSLHEISIVELGADDQTSVQIAAGAITKKTKNTEIFDGVKKMTISELKRVAAGFDGLIDQKTSSELILEAAEAGDDETSFTARLVAAAKTEKERAEKESKLNALRASRSNTLTASSAGSISASPTEILSAAAFLMANSRSDAERLYSPAALNAAESLHCRTLMDVAERSLTLTGHDVPSGTSRMLEASFSTGSLPSIMTDLGNKTLRVAFDSGPQTCRKVGFDRSVRNFLPHRMVQAVVGGGMYSEVGAGGELKHVSYSDDTLTHSASTRGVILTITRQMLINDDLSIISDMFRTIGLNAARTVNKVFWEKLKSAGSAFFDDTLYGNLPTPGAGNALTFDGLSVAIQRARQMKDADGNPIAAEPKFLVVPPALEPVARNLVLSTEIRMTESNKKFGTANSWAGALEIVVEPLLAEDFGGSDTTWYVVLDKNILPSMILSFLNGIDHPTVEQSDLPFDQLGVGLRAYLDFGCDFGDPRGAIKMATS